MQVVELPLMGLKLIQLRVFRDDRGFFMERFQCDKFQELGLPTTFAQDNHSRSCPGVLRGLHFQQNPDQGKLVGVVRGRIWDVVVDIRPHSPTLGQHYSVELSDENGYLLWIPGGFAHGFCVLGDQPADVFYKADVPFQPASEGGIFWADRDLSIPWPVTPSRMSARDRGLPGFKNFLLAQRNSSSLAWTPLPDPASKSGWSVPSRAAFAAPTIQSSSTPSSI